MILVHYRVMQKLRTSLIVILATVRAIIYEAEASGPGPGPPGMMLAGRRGWSMPLISSELRISAPFDSSALGTTVTDR